MADKFTRYFIFRFHNVITKPFNLSFNFYKTKSFPRTAIVVIQKVTFDFFLFCQTEVLVHSKQINIEVKISRFWDKNTGPKTHFSNPRGFVEQQSRERGHGL